MKFVFKMNMANLGSFLLKGKVVDTREGRRACQDYGKAVGEMLRV